jgi:SAM-dependent methyltransferase
MTFVLATRQFQLERSLPADRTLNFFGRELAAMPKRERAQWMQRAFVYWRTNGFPHPVLTADVAKREITLLRRVGQQSLHQVLASPSTVGLRFANSFHPQMWNAKIRGRSPVECFADDNLLRGALEKAIRFWPDRRCWNGRAIRILMSIQNRSRVSNFRPTVARALIDTFTEPGASVLDFSAGYGGRLLGAATLGRRYTGVDPANGQYVGLLRMSDVLGADANIIQGCAEDILPTMPNASFDLVFSSPPYFRLERYDTDQSQSFRRYPSYLSWLDGFLRPIIRNVHRLLRIGGRFAVNVANIPRFPIAIDADCLSQEYFGAPEAVLSMNMSSNPADKARRGKLFRSEPIFVYRK